jgi:hypothetical protein
MICEHNSAGTNATPQGVVIRKPSLCCLFAGERPPFMVHALAEE